MKSRILSLNDDACIVLSFSSVWSEFGRAIKLNHHNIKKFHIKLSHRFPQVLLIKGGWDSLDTLIEKCWDNLETVLDSVLNWAVLFCCVLHWEPLIKLCTGPAVTRGLLLTLAVAYYASSPSTAQLLVTPSQYQESTLYPIIWDASLSLNL